jgi:SAM-dependent methyltransferase
MNIWEGLAKQNAEFFILSHEGVDFSSIEGQEYFYKTGQSDSQWLFAEVSSLLPGRSLAIEIGCGLGRLTIPHAQWFEIVHAVDVSPTMLERLQEICQQRGQTNIRTFLPNQSWDVTSAADYAYSFIVFQHIEQEEIIQDYLNRIGQALRPGGIALLHFDTRPPDLTYTLKFVLPDSLLPRTQRRGIRRIRRSLPWLYAAVRKSNLEIVHETNPGSPAHFLTLRRPG